MKLSSDEIDTLARAVGEWIGMLDKPPTPADADHSSLLRRLLSGERPFPFKPPRRFSYPDYRLAAGECVLVMECWEPKEALGKAFDCDLIIDQARWRIVERTANGYIAEWPAEPGSRYIVTHVLPKDDRRPEMHCFTVQREKKP